MGFVPSPLFFLIFKLTNLIGPSQEEKKIGASQNISFFIRMKNLLFGPTIYIKR
jgi:hypothetical protein